MAKSKRIMGFGGLWHDSGDGRLYAEETGGTALYGGLTFHQVAKEYVFARPALNPNPFYNPFMFPTTETVSFVTGWLKKEFPRLAFTVTGNPAEPAGANDAPQVLISSPLTGAVSEHVPGYLAIGIANNAALAKESLRDELKVAGVLF